MNIFKKVVLFLIVLCLTTYFLPLKAESNTLEIFYFNKEYQLDEVKMELYDLEENLIDTFTKEEKSCDKGISWFHFWLEDFSYSEESFIIKISLGDNDEKVIDFQQRENVFVYYLENGILATEITQLNTKITYATFTSFNEIRFFADNQLTEADLKVLKTKNEVYFEEEFSLQSSHPEYIIHLDDIIDPSFNYDYYLEVSTSCLVEPTKIYVRYDEIYSDPYSESYLKYDDKDLGVTYQSSFTMFKLWAPTLDSVKLNLYNSNNQKQSYSMNKNERGVFTYQKSGNMANYEYTFSFTRDYEEYEIIDPYAKYISENNRGLVVDSNATNIANFSNWQANINVNSYADYLVYESSIEQLTGSLTDENLKNKFAGLTTKGLTINVSGNVYPVGLDYLIELGVTHLTLSDLINTQYSFNTINNKYSSNNNPTTATIELKQMIKALGDNGIGVILDLDVYQEIIWGLEFLLPGYYYETKQGNPIVSDDNYSFFATNNIMTNRYFEAQISYLVEEFKFSGLKISPLNALNFKHLNEQLRVLAETENFLIYGEFLDASLVEPIGKTDKLTSQNLHSVRHIGFIDSERFSLADNYITSFSNDGLKGYILSGNNSTYSTLSPKQSFKRLDYFNGLSEDALKQIKTVQLLSYGVIVLNGGEEIGFYEEDKPLDYRLQEKNSDIFLLYKSLLKFRKEHSSLQFTDRNTLKDEIIYNIIVDKKIVSYQITNPKDIYPDILIIHNFGEKTTFELPIGLDGVLHYNRDGELNWQVAFDNLNYYKLGKKYNNNDFITLEKNQSVILHHGLNIENIIEDPIESPEPPKSKNLVYYLLIGGGILVIGGILITYFILKSTKNQEEK